MGAGVVMVGRRAYAVGLYWENSPSGRVAQAAREAARHPGQQADYYALRGGNKDGRVPQFGLGQTSAGHKAGMPVFAACLANQQTGSWVGAFRMRDGIVVTVVRDDLIVPDGDQYYTNESEARDRVLQEIGFGGLQRIYAPEAWAIPAADSMPISLLLDERRDITLRTVRIPKQILIGGAIAAALLVIGAGVTWYIQEKEAEEEAARAAQLAEIQRMRDAAKKMLPGALQNGQPEYPPPERKWEKQPLPLQMVEICRAGLSQIPATNVGWHIVQINCDGSSISISWQHDKGMSRPPPGAVLNESFSSATASISLKPAEARGAENLVDPDVVAKRYLAQDWPGSLVPTADDPPPPPPQGYTGQWNPPPAPWIKRSFTLTVRQLPASLSVYFSGLPGVVIKSLTLNPGTTGTTGDWRIEGVIYENRV